ncbi:MAG: HNH endonuclease [Candidatus Thiodiazotropha taylori]|nr:HNH endonuclease [Candidatus Thiodiazotropha taylori]MCG8097345.1 HNH endonuclease [Candidatus Thiodiazotropha endolucinida]MCG8108864.1 HNH endonuclease [Candidatus Thiodiazotropha taylori]MCG8112956.1 HNH endonuclease [Candidatus Thiodiazotropha taylori]MCW4281200.1 HNH endonuclease [Candidatus Thiodiazotropha taylori]
MLKNIYQQVKSVTDKLAAVEALRLLHYDPETGQITWNQDRGTKTKKGDRAGTIVPRSDRTSSPYRIVKVYGVAYPAHRVAWLLHHGEWPQYDIQHINGNRLDNRLVNLRLVDRDTKKQLKRVRYDNKSGVTGVNRSKSNGKWVTSIVSDGAHNYLGTTEDFFEAVCRRKSAENQLGFYEVSPR